MKYRHMIFAAAIVAIPGIDYESATVSIAPGAQAQQMGNRPWSFSQRNPSMAAQFDFTRKVSNGNGSAATADGLGALNQYVTQYNSTSTSIGNLNEVTQILSGGSRGSVGQSTDQTATGSQGSTATTDTTVSNTTANGSGANVVNGSQAIGTATQAASDNK